MSGGVGGEGQDEPVLPYPDRSRGQRVRAKIFMQINRKYGTGTHLG
jgi:hypothetical protein